jgi:MFS family permease
MLFVCHLRANGFADDIATYGMVSGLWTSFFSLGAFVGPTVGGVLYDTVGFRNGTLFPVSMNGLVVSWQAAQCRYILAHGMAGCDSSVGIATGYGLDGPGIESW